MVKLQWKLLYFDDILINFRYYESNQEYAGSGADNDLGLQTQLSMTLRLSDFGPV